VKFRPLHDRVLVRRIEEDGKSKGGIIIPDTAKEKPMEGEVIAVGPGARGDDGRLQPLHVKTGDRVLFGKWSGTEIRIEDQDVVVMKEDDILGIVRAAADTDLPGIEDVPIPDDLPEDSDEPSSASDKNVVQ
jgi:chaperonin GroES